MNLEQNLNNIQKINNQPVGQKERNKHPTNDQLLEQLLEVIKQLKTIPKSSSWNNLSIVKKENFFSKHAFLNHFGSFEKAIEKALEKAKKEGIKIFYIKQN